MMKKQFLRRSYFAMLIASSVFGLLVSNVQAQVAITCGSNNLGGIPDTSSLQPLSTVVGGTGQNNANWQWPKPLSHIGRCKISPERGRPFHLKLCNGTDIWRSGPWRICCR